MSPASTKSRKDGDSSHDLSGANDRLRVIDDSTPNPPSDHFERRTLRLMAQLVGNRAAGWLVAHILTRENAYAVLIALILLVLLMFGAPGRQPTFVYGGF